jgi:hypothetical protein
MVRNATPKPQVGVALGKDNKSLSGGCANCHATGLFNAKVIASSAGHQDPDGATVVWTRGQCMGCHAGHAGAGGVIIPMPTTAYQYRFGTAGNNNPFVALFTSSTAYTSHGGINLGGNGTYASTFTTSTAEADMCWGCHNAVGVSEWGVNTDTNGTAPNYNFGTLTGGPSWLGSGNGAVWTSAQTASPSFSYKTASILSTHAANPNTGVSGRDAANNIRCSYCHDVHDTKGPTGKPYIRGTWKGNPYKEDGAPQLSQTYTNVSPWGLVPRATPAQQSMGGYWIDQNSGNPAGTWTVADSAGLCELCHGDGNGTFAAAEIDGLYTFSGLEWTSGLNGHRNALLGATGGDTVAARNIFAGRGGANTQTTATAMHPYQAYSGSSMPGNDAGGLRGPNSTPMYKPAMATDPQDGGGWDGTLWGTSATPNRALDLTGATVNAGYHQFPCSKCHNPHASRLPRLMITNCLDTKHNTWDNSYQVIGNTYDTTLYNRGRSISNWTSAQNCHRKAGEDPSDADDVSANAFTGTAANQGNNGWNTITPW